MDVPVFRDIQLVESTMTFLLLKRIFSATNTFKTNFAIAKHVAYIL